ncbi:hypothetical protein CBER1_06113 [Cercospora berteroae]|uniref:SURP motif domain-containing protein n=1 Tax=Cercospora berteroae TaxID=357750 RepID=A0A2S6C3L8_9PEZI|nr:hypothetical protein CBER1_06113 [Cercospora berteroae]
MSLLCPPTHLSPWSFDAGVLCTIPQCPRYGLAPGIGKEAERAPESEEVQTASKQQKTAEDLYREATQTAVKYPDEGRSWSARLREFKDNRAKKITASQSGAYIAGVPQLEPAGQWPGFTRERDDWYRGRDPEHDRPVGWQPDAFSDLKSSPPQSNTVPYNKNRMLPDWPGPFVLEQSTMGNSQVDTFTDFAPGKNVPSSRQRHLRKLSFASDKHASCTDTHDWNTVISSNESEVEFTPEPTPEQEESHAISAPAEASEVQVQPNSAHHNLTNTPGKPVYKFVPFRNVPRIIDEGTSEDYQRWLEVSNRLGCSGSARPPSSEAGGKNNPNSRPVRNDYKINSSGSGPMRRVSMTFATGDLVEKIEKVARYVARSGPKFEEVVRSKNQCTDIVSFLEPTNTYHTYYKWRVAECQAGNTYDFESEKVSAETDSWSEHINSDGRKHWYNKVSHEFVWDKLLALVAQFQLRKEIGTGIEKRELDFLGDCVKFLPSAVRSKAIAVVDKLQNIAYGALSGELPAEIEDDATQKLQKVEAALKLIESRHADTESALLKRIEELENKQTPQMPEATVTKLNTLYDKLVHVVDQGLQRLESNRTTEKDQEAVISKIQQRIEEQRVQASELTATQGRICEEVGEVVNARMKEFRVERTLIDDGHKEIVSALLKRIEDLEEKQSFELPEPITSRLHEVSDKLVHIDGRLTKFESVQEAIDTKNTDTLTELQQRIDEHDKKQSSDLEAVRSDQQELFAGLRSAREQIDSFESDLKPIKDEHVSAVAKLRGRMEAFEEQVISNLPSTLSQLSDSISVVQLRQKEFETGRKPIDAEHTKSMNALQLRIETIENYQGIERLQAIEDKLHEASLNPHVSRNQIAALEAGHEKQVEATGKVDQKAGRSQDKDYKARIDKIREVAEKAREKAASAQRHAIMAQYKDITSGVSRRTGTGETKQKAPINTLPAVPRVSESSRGAVGFETASGLDGDSNGA